MFKKLVGLTLLIVLLTPTNTVNAASFSFSAFRDVIQNFLTKNVTKTPEETKAIMDVTEKIPFDQMPSGKEYNDMVKEASKLSKVGTPTLEDNISFIKKFSKVMTPFYQKLGPIFKKETPVAPATKSNPAKTNETGSNSNGMGVGSSMEEQYRESEKQQVIDQNNYIKETSKMSDSSKVEYTALVKYSGYLYSKDGIYSKRALAVMNKLGEMRKKYDLSETTSGMIAIEVYKIPSLSAKVEQRYNELLASGL